MKSTIARFVLIGSVGVSGCAEMAPALTQAVVEIGRDFIGQTAANYAPDYAQSVNNLLLTMAEITTGAPFASAPGGYQAHAAYDDPNAAYNDQAYNDPGYANQTYENQDYDDQGYNNQGYDPMAGGETPVYGDSVYGGAVNEPYDPMVTGNKSYGQGGYNNQYDPAQPGGYSSQPPQQVSYGAPQSSQAYTPNNQPLSLTAELLAQSFSPDGRVVLRPVSDGDVLTDGRGNSATGDKFKLRFQANCDCYLYIIGVDATGWVTQIMPEAGKASFPIAANQSHLIPQGSEWWGLDEYRGVEHIYFILSQTRRTDLEQALAPLPVDRPPPGAGYSAVQEPTLFATRGLVKVQSQAPDGSASPTSLNQAPSSSFSTEMLTGDLIITRWFQHQ